MIAATVRIGGRRITLVNTHPSGAGTQAQAGGGRLRRLVRRMGSTSRVISAQVQGTVDFAHKTPGPVVIVGDFNMPRLSQAHRGISGEYRDAFRAAGWGFGYTYRSNLPFQRIDYAFVGKSVAVRSCRVLGCPASDHRPVVAEVILER